MIVNMLLVALLVTFIVLYQQKCETTSVVNRTSLNAVMSQNNVVDSRDNALQNKIASIKNPAIHIYMFLFHVGNVELMNTQLAYMAKAVNESYKTILIMDNQDVGICGKTSASECFNVPPNTLDQASHRHAFALNWCTSTIVKNIQFEENDICMYIDGDLFFITDIEPSKLMTTDIRYLRQRPSNEYPWPGYLWFKPKRINLDLLDLGCTNGGDTGSMGVELLKNTQSKYAISFRYHTENMEAKTIQPNVVEKMNAHWQLTKQDNLLEVCDDDRYMHIRGLTSNWMQNPYAKERFDIFKLG